MNNNHFIDAFYRTYDNVNENTQARTPEPGIKLVDDNWDAQSKRLVNVNPGVGIGDAVTTDQALIRSDNSFKVGSKKYEFMETNKNVWDGKKRKITDLGTGEADSDAATVGQIMRGAKGSWHAKKMKISNVVAGTTKDDVAVYSQIPKDCLQLKNSKWDGKNKIIENVAKGSKGNDVAVYSQIPKDCLQLKNSKWDGKSKIIENVAKGSKSNDVAVISQIPKDCLQLKDDKWNGNNKKITSVTRGTDDNDVAIVAQLPTDYMKSDKTSWTADNKKISNVKEGDQPNDVLTFNQALKPSNIKGEFYTNLDTTYKFMQPVIFKLRGEELPTGKMVNEREVWDGRDMPIRDIAPGYYDTDACQIGQAMVLDYPNCRYYKANQKQICDIKPGTKYGDALVFEQALRIENNELCLGNRTLELYFNESNGDQIRVFFKDKD